MALTRAEMFQKSVLARFAGDVSIACWLVFSIRIGFNILVSDRSYSAPIVFRSRSAFNTNTWDVQKEG